MFNIIKKRIIAYLGHVMLNSKYEFLQLIIEGKIEGYRRLERNRMFWLRKWAGLHNIPQSDGKCGRKHPLMHMHCQKKKN